ncbi:carbohydrate ABC transporter permease [Prosthecomicrobium pneumaticum]|uniref:Multiple sugar transport system permease protein n=1 Tax=Prosthecomicrobium pneumaticum TaxID=81895 RepID=A0A7W9CTD1_9HYPH|nr:sugar ABC transporter permease [Prosthecomicrobium pneumaticum]MBB5751560.1 multiple sugar transport system permease protein [Prosthecomicrobium pneumaticum]
MLDWRFWFVAPMVLALGIVVLFPSGYLVWMSLTHWLVTDPNVYFDGIGNFRVLFRSAEFSSAIGVTAIYLVASTAAMLAFSLGLALAFRSPRTPGALRSIVIMPLVIPPVVAGFTWRFLMNGEMGFIGAFLLPEIGIRTNMLADPTGAMISIVIADVWSRAPFMFLIFLAALQSIPRDYYEAIRLDGANRLQEFLHVTLPMIRPAIVVALLFRVIDALNTFELIYVMTKGGPGRATQTLSLFGWKTAFQNFDFGLAAALGVVMVVVTTVCASIVYRRFLRAPA